MNLKANLARLFANPNAGDLETEHSEVALSVRLQVWQYLNLQLCLIQVMQVILKVQYSIKMHAFSYDAGHQNRELQRDASLSADEIVVTAVYGVGELHDSYGVELHFDSINPIISTMGGIFSPFL